MFPEVIEKIVKGLSYQKDDIGRSGDSVFLFENRYVLKCSNDGEKLKREKEKTDWLRKYIPSAESVCFTEENNRYYYLRTALQGDSLIAERFMKDPEALTDVLVNVIGILRSLDQKECPFDSFESKGDDFVHGDLCLPNIFVNQENAFIGLIDVENAGKGDRWHDYAWLLWSLSYNLKTEQYNTVLLEKLGIEFDEEKFEKYIPAEFRGMRFEG
ncbi:MAG: phosphotransferase [Solobacterium sp.]|nr:phosphotransferase [Solobacterium sp.]